MLHLIPSHQTRPSDDLIFALNGEAVRRKAAGESVINATLGSLMNDDGTLAVLPSTVRALREVPVEEWAAYAPIAGTPAFLNAVIDDYFQNEPSLKAAAVAAATPGGTGALRHAISNYLEVGQSLLTTSYFWGPYQTICDEHDRKLDTFSMFAADGTFDVAALDAKVSEHLTKQKRVLLFLNDPCHNPTGFSMRREEWKQVVSCLLKHASTGANITLLVDTAYYLYGSAADPRAFITELKPLLGQVGLLFAWSASKSFTHYGLRVGALVACVADEKERAATAAALSYSCRGTWSNCNRGGLHAITRLLTDAALKAACDTERAQLKAMLTARVNTFNEHAKPLQLKYPRYEGGFFVTVFTSDAHSLANRMKEQGVFGVPQKGAVRLALCSVAQANVPRLVESLRGA